VLFQIAMRSRDTILDLFSTFAFLEGDRVRQWLLDPRLRRSMQKCLTDANAPDADISEKAWSLYWYKIWQSHHELLALSPLPTPPAMPIAQQHLAAYLQEPCYWAAHKTAQRFPGLEFTLADYFQLISSETGRVLKGFNPSFGTNLKSYAPIVLTNILKDHLRQRRAIDVCSDWSLLRKISQKRITEVLNNAGVSPNELEQYNFAWVCFKTVSVPTTRPDADWVKTSQLEAPMWAAIADLYNSQHHSQHHSQRPPQLARSAAPMTPEQLETRLTKLTRWIRAYLYPAVDSLNKPKPGQEQGEIQDSLADPLATSLLEAAIADEDRQERHQQQSQLQETLARALTDLDQTAQRILRLFYEENLSQQELADRMAMSQPTVSRRLKKAEAALLAKIIDSVKGEVNNLPDPSELKHISIALKEWLTVYYRRG
jgi:RNA polymerase sigma factor (sigma-70 family)